MIRRIFDRGPSPRKPYDNDPYRGPPRLICSVCGLKYLPVPGEDSPCGLTKKDGTVVP